MSAPHKIASDPQISAKVSANAGTGKTWILASRVLRLLLAGVHPSKILCLTFTKAAAAEMKGRVIDVLKKWVMMPDDKLTQEIYELTGELPNNDVLRRAAALFTETLQSMPPPRIQTIHSFAQEILNKFPLEAGITPHFEVIDEITANELIEESKNRLLEGSDFAPNISAAVEFLASYCAEETFTDLLNSIIKNRIRFRLSVPPEANLPYQEFDFTMPQLPRVAYAMLNSKNENDNSRGEKIMAAVKSKNFELLEEIFLTKEGHFRQRLLTKDAKKLLPDSEEALAFLQRNVCEFSNYLILQQELEFSQNAYLAGQGMLKIYDDIKSSLGVLDYDDLIFYTRKLLLEANATQWILYKLDSSIEHILVDEAQDTTPQQWEIISAIVDEFFAGEGAAKRNRTIFIVGDEKQSIYSFQGADPRGFAEVTKFIGQKCVEAGKTWREIPLTKSYRSLPEVLGFVDKAFFPENLRSAITNNNKVITHEANRIGQGRVEIWPVTRAEDIPEIQEWEFPTKIYSHKNEKTLLAEKIAEQINLWVSSGKAKYSDITILLKKRSDFADLLIHKMKERGIAVSGLDRLRLTDNIAIQDLLSLANFLLLPEDDLSLAEVLKSPLFGVSEEELFLICYNRSSSVWDSIKSSELKSKLQNLIKLAEEISVYELFSYVLDVDEGRKNFIGRLGEAVNDPLDEFLSMAMDFEQSHTNSLQEFVHWFVSGGTEIKRDMEGKSEQVRIMTVHASKGLQSKIIILPDTTSLPNYSKKKIFFSDKNEFFTFPSGERRSQLASKLISEAAAREYEEYLRLLYVALTRAEDEVYICGHYGEKAVPPESWYGLLTVASTVNISDL